MHLIDAVRQAFVAHGTALFPESVAQQALATSELVLNVDPRKAAFGDLSSNVAMQLAKLLGVAPRVVAQKLIEGFTHPAVARVEIAGPGFINIFLAPHAYGEILANFLHDGSNALKPTISKTSYNIEFVSANPTGPLHIGHGRGGIIGDVLARVLRFMGHDVTAEFYINDAGVQIKTLGASLRARVLSALGTPTPVPEEGYQGEYLVALAQQCIAQHGKEVETQPESFFSEYAKNALLAQQQETLKNYGITFDVWFSEKTLHDSGAITTALEQLKSRDALYEKDGATWLASTRWGDDKDRVVIKKGGELTYVAADVAYLKNKLGRGAKKLVMVLGQDHHSYVHRLKAVLSAFGDNPDDLSVILYQLVTIKEDGEQLRLSKRAGRIVTLDDVITTVGKDVARFFYLHRKADAHLDFDLALALKHSDENPVYYIQYAFVRMASILEKAREVTELNDITAHDAHHIGMEESMLLRKILALSEIISAIERTEQTHLLAYYAVELAQQFHAFYNDHRVIDREHITQSRARLALVLATQQTLGLCLDLMGLEKPRTM